MALEYKPYKDGDEKQILDLFKVTFGVDLAPSFWRWRQLENPAGGPWTEMVWDGDRLAGHYAVAAAKMSINGEAVPASLSMTTALQVAGVNVPVDVIQMLPFAMVMLVLLVAGRKASLPAALGESFERGAR